nr:hypothetical protein [Tanacetum cinerariifolium]
MQVDRKGLLNATTDKGDIWLGNALGLSDQGMQHGIRIKQLMICRMQKQFSWPTFPTMVLMLSQSHEKMIDSQMDDMIKEKLPQKEQVDSLKKNVTPPNWVAAEIRVQGVLLHRSITQDIY